MNKIALTAILIAGCSTFTEDAIYRAEVDNANWLNCAAEYKRQHKVTYHIHIHDERRINRQDIRDDLTWNDCKKILGDEWLNY